MLPLALVLVACTPGKPDTADTADAVDTDVPDTANPDSGDTGRDTGDTAVSGTDTGDTGRDTSDTSDTSDTGATDPLCEAALPTEPPADGCLEARALGCGDVVEATLEGGDRTYGAESWEGWACTVNADRHDYAGPERGWRLALPARTTARVVLDTPCADLDVFAVYWQDDTCPNPVANIHVCEAGDGTGDTDTARVVTVDAEQDLVFVDAKDGGLANFRLSVLCE